VAKTFLLARKYKKIEKKICAYKPIEIRTPKHFTLPRQRRRHPDPRCRTYASEPASGP
jgi:hypothetical protein